MWGMRWTRLEEDRAVELATTHTARQIGEVLNRPKAGVLRILTKHGVDPVQHRWETRTVWSNHDPHPPYTPAEKREQARLRMRRIREQRKYNDERAHRESVRRDARYAAD